MSPGPSATSPVAPIRPSREGGSLEANNDITYYNIMLYYIILYYTILYISYDIL